MQEEKRLKEIKEQQRLDEERRRCEESENLLREVEAKQAGSRKEAEDVDQQRKDEINRLQQAHKTLKLDYDELR